jgi:hypothetical protein
MRKEKIMRKLAITMMVIMTICLAVGAAMAGDSIINTTVDSATVAMTKNGNEYVRFIITEQRKLDGVAYDRSLPLMAFGDLVQPAKAYKAGDPIKVVASYRKLPDGRESYTILSFINQ